MLVGTDEGLCFEHEADGALVHIKTGISIIVAIGQEARNLRVMQVAQCLVGCVGTVLYFEGRPQAVNGGGNEIHVVPPGLNGALMRRCVWC